MRTFVVVTGLSLLACSSGGDDDDSGKGEGTDAETTSTVDGTISDVHLEELDDPCMGGGTPYGLWFDGDEGFIGCGNGFGLHHTEDAGVTTRRIDKGDLYVFRIDPDADGNALVCGNDYAEDSVLLYRMNGTKMEALAKYGNNGSDPSAVYISNCGGVGGLSGGRLFFASNTIGDVTWSTDDGVTWAEAERYWEDDNLDSGGYSVYQMLEVEAAGGALYGAGSFIGDPPVFFGPSTHKDAEWTNFDATVIDASVTGEVWALGSPDGGATWFAGGRDQTMTTEASGFFFRSTDGGLTWSRIKLGGDIDVMQDVAFAPDGKHGVAVGHRYPTSRGGFVLLTADGGTTWEELAEAPPTILYSAFATNKRFWIGGDYYFASASW